MFTTILAILLLVSMIMNYVLNKEYNYVLNKQYYEFHLESDKECLQELSVHKAVLDRYHQSGKFRIVDNYIVIDLGETTYNRIKQLLNIVNKVGCCICECKNEFVFPGTNYKIKMMIDENRRKKTID